MDDNKGNFQPITMEEYRERMSMDFPIKNTYSDEPIRTGPQVFKEGEILEIRGSRLRVEKIYKHKLVLKLLPQLKTNEEERK